VPARFFVSAKIALTTLRCPHFPTDELPPLSLQAGTTGVTEALSGHDADVVYWKPHGYFLIFFSNTVHHFFAASR